MMYYYDLGGIIIGKPSCTRFGSFQEVLCGTIGADSSVYVNRWAYYESGEFTSLGGVSISNPACTGLGVSTKAVCVIVGANSHLFASTTLDGVNWTTFADLDLGGTLIFNPTCVDMGNMTGFCGAVTTDGELRLARFNAVSGPVFFDPNTNIIIPPPTAHTYCILGRPCNPNTLRITSDPSCATGVTAAVICGVRGSDGVLYVSQFNGITFSLFQFEGGVLAGVPSCASGVCAVRGTDSQLYVIQFLSIGTLGFTPVQPAQPETYIKGDPSCALIPSGTFLVCGVKTTDSTLWTTMGH